MRPFHRTLKDNYSLQRRAEETIDIQLKSMVAIHEACEEMRKRNVRKTDALTIVRY